MTKLGDYMHSTKIWSVFEYQGQKSKVKVTGDKKRKSAAFLFGSRPLGSGPGAAFFRRQSSGARLRQWGNQRMLS